MESAGAVDSVATAGSVDPVGSASEHVGLLTTSQVNSAPSSRVWRTSFSTTAALARLTPANNVRAPTTAPTPIRALRGPGTGERQIRASDARSVPLRIGVSMKRYESSVMIPVRIMANTNS